MATQVWAVRLGEFHIPVYEVRPGVIKSDMTKPVTEKYDKLIAEGLTLQRRWGLPEDIGKAVAMMVSEPPSSMFRAAPKKRLGFWRALASTPPERILPEWGTSVL